MTSPKSFQEGTISPEISYLKSTDIGIICPGLGYAVLTSLKEKFKQFILFVTWQTSKCKKYLGGVKNDKIRVEGTYVVIN